MSGKREKYHTLENTFVMPYQNLIALFLFSLCKDQDALLQELHNVRYFDVFEFNAVKKYWACFMCNHPEKMSELMPDGHPVIAVGVCLSVHPLS